MPMVRDKVYSWMSVQERTNHVGSPNGDFSSPSPFTRNHRRMDRRHGTPGVDVPTRRRAAQCGGRWGCTTQPGTHLPTRWWDLAHPQDDDHDRSSLWSLCLVPKRGVRRPVEGLQDRASLRHKLAPHIWSAILVFRSIQQAHCREPATWTEQRMVYVCWFLARLNLMLHESLSLLGLPHRVPFHRGILFTRSLGWGPQSA